MIILIYLIILPFLIFLFFYLLFLVDTLRGHDLPTTKRAIKRISKIISEHTLENCNFYDLGCGRGTIVVAIKKRFPQFRIYGIDKSSLRLFFAKLKTHILRQEVFFQKADLLTIDLKKADIVYTYLWYDLMPPLEKKLKRELKPGAIVITNTSNFPNWKPVKTYITFPKKPEFEKLFVYKKIPSPKLG